jgi:hypothetical protein
MTYSNPQARKSEPDRKTDLREGAELAGHPGWRKFGVAMLGAGVGLGAGLLLAPASGATVRGKVRHAASRAKEKIPFRHTNGVKEMADDASSAMRRGAQGLEERAGR